MAIMERISNVVSFETRGLQTADDMLELDSPINASLMVPLPGPLQPGSYAAHNGASAPAQASSSYQNGTGPDMDEADDRPEPGDCRPDSGYAVPAGVEVIQPSRPPGTEARSLWESPFLTSGFGFQLTASTASAWVA